MRRAPPVAFAWAAVLGVVGAVTAAASSAIAAQMANLSPETVQTFRSALPIDVTTPAGLLEFGIVQVGFLALGPAAATLVSGWADDESSGRLGVLLATPLTRARWAAAGGVGVYVAIGLITALLGPAAQRPLEGRAAYRRWLAAAAAWPGRNPCQGRAAPTHSARLRRIHLGRVGEEVASRSSRGQKLPSRSTLRCSRAIFATLTRRAEVRCSG